MAVRQFGLAAILSFVDKGASGAMKRVGAAASALKKNFRGIGAGLGQMNRGLGAVALASAPVGLAFGFMIRDGMKFEQAMANLRAVTLDSTGKITESLKQLAKTMGSQTVFSASQAADAMTNLARAGLKADQIAKAIPGTLAAAAAEGIDLATAAGLVSSNMKAFRLDAKKAAEVAGSLALVSARTNTNMVLLQEGMKLAAPTAKLAGFEFKETALALGSLADIGLKGTMAGTALRSALGQILSPTNKVLKAIGGRSGLNKILRDSEGNMKPLAEIMLGFSNHLRKIPDDGKRTDVAMRIFGKRAVAVTSAFDLTGESLDDFRRKQIELAKETGDTATIMAELQLQTLGGQLKLVRSAVEAVNIELFGLISGGLRSGVRNLAAGIGKVALALRVVRGEKFVDPKTLKDVETLPKKFLEIAKGIQEGFAAAKGTLKDIGATLGVVGKWLGFTGEDGVKGIARMITKFTILLAVIGPVSIALLGATKVLGGFLNIGIGGLKVLIGSFKLLKTVMLAPVGAARALANALPKGAAGVPGPSPFPGAPGAPAKGAGGLLKSLGKASLGLAAAGAAGFAFGRWLDNKFGISDTIANGLWNLFDASEARARQERLATRTEEIDVTSATRMVSQLAAIAASGKKTVGTAAGGTTALTRELAVARVTKFLQAQGANQERIAEVLTGLSSTLARIPSGGAGLSPEKPKKAGDAIVTSPGIMGVSAGDVVLNRAALAAAVTSRLGGGLAGEIGGGALGGGDPGRTTPVPAPVGSGSPLRIEVPLTIDGREIALAVAEVQLDQLERSGASMKPGDRASLLQRGFALEGV